MRRIYIAGVGLTKVEEHWDKSLDFIISEAAIKALRDAEAVRIDSIYVGNMCSEVLQFQSQLGAIIAEELGLSGTPSLRVEAASASGAAALRQAYLDIAAGESEVVLVVGGEKLSDGMAEEVTAIAASADRYDYTGYQGATMPCIAALLYKIYLNRYGASQENVAFFPVIMHENASTSSHAQYPFKISLEAVLRSPYISEPLRRLECASIGDGAAALVLCSEEVAKNLRGAGLVEVAACNVATDYVSPFDREDVLMFNALAIAVDKALRRAGVRKEDIDILEVHDEYSITAALSLESSGFSQRGKSGIEARAGRFSLGGDLPINTFGGLKARGHPFGATPIYQIAEAYLQLVGRAGKNQVDGAEIGMVQSLGGFATTAVATILRAV